MSLINDALQRAKQTPGAAKPAPELGTTMKPAPPPRTTGLPMYFLPMLLLLVSGACWFLVKGWNTRSPDGASARAIPVQARASQATSSATGAESPTPTNRHLTLSDSPKPAASTNTTPATAAAPVESAPETGTIPGYKLQGIFYRPSNPSAVINSKTVFLGDRIANAKVKAIDRQSVTLDLEGETKVLTLQ
jgi:hypothetical protein